MKEVQHTHNAGALFQAFLKRMDERAKAEVPMLEAKAIDAEPVSPPLAQDQQPLDNQGLARDHSSEDDKEGIGH